MARIYIDRYTAKITRSDLYLVNVTMKDGTVHENLEPRRLFPISNTTMYITLLDQKEKEIAFVRDLAELDEDSAKALTECFGEFYRIPYITRLVSSEEKFGSLTWSVETNHGPVKFRIRNRHSDIKMMQGKRIFVRDTNDNRYEIPDWTALDQHSKHLLFSYL
jgi:hypothetical protein